MSRLFFLALLIWLPGLVYAQAYCRLPATDDPDWQLQRPLFQLDLEQQAAYIVQAAALALPSDVERLAV